MFAVRADLGLLDHRAWQVRNCAIAVSPDAAPAGAGVLDYATYLK